MHQVLHTLTRLHKRIHFHQHPPPKIHKMELIIFVHECFCWRREKSISLFSRWRLAVNSHNYRSELVIIWVFVAYCFHLVLFSLSFFGSRYTVNCICVFARRSVWPIHDFHSFGFFAVGFLVAHCNSTIEIRISWTFGKKKNSNFSQRLTVFGLSSHPLSLFLAIFGQI